MTGPWQAFISDRLARVLADADQGMLPGLVDGSDSVVLFADVAGFTPMTEALKNAGRYGTEELTQLLGDCFQAMGEVVARYGGDIIQYAGDAMTVAWEADGGCETHGHAVRCALEMQTAVAGFDTTGTSVGTFNVTLRIGIAAGPTAGAVVGVPAGRLQYLLLGEAVDRAAKVGQRAPLGGVAVDGSVQLDGEDPGVKGQDVRVIRRLHIPGPPPRGPAGSGARPDLPHDMIARFLHPVVAERLHSNRQNLLGELREITTLFAGLPAVEPDADGVARLQDVVEPALRVIDRYEGNLQRVGTGDKGALLLAWFGGPRSHEDDEERAVSCCLELLRLPHPPLRAAVTTGLAFCGEVGSAARREYTIMGDSVNLAARLMQKAGPQQLLIDAATHQRVARTAVADYLEPMAVKGKTTRVGVWSVRGIGDQPPQPLEELASATRLVGRQRERRLLRRLTSLAADGHGQILGIVGDAGIGKTRLAAEAARLARRADFQVFHGACRSHATSAAYFTWRPIGAAILGVDRSTPADTWSAQLAASLASCGPEWSERTPLLAPVLNLQLPDTGLTASLDPAVKADLLRSLFLELLQLRARQAPVLLVIEDCHWIDQASRTLLEHLVRNVLELPVWILLTARPGGDSEALLPASAAMGHAQELRLEALPRRDAESLARAQLQLRYGTAVDPASPLARQVADRARGNPFFLQELVRFLHARGVEPSDEAAIAALDPPHSIERLVMAQLDQLTEADSSTIKVASVIGPRFRPAWIWGAYPEAGIPMEVMTSLERLNTLGLASRRSTAPELEYAFGHAIIQEIVYGTLPRTLREQLHEQIGSHIETIYRGALGQWVNALAYHYGQTQNVRKKRRWFRAAADRAKAAFDNEVAIDYYERLIELLPDEAEADTFLQLGIVRHLTGRWPEAEQAYRTAMDTARRIDAQTVVAASQRELGTLVAVTKSYAAGEDWLCKAASGFDQLDDRRGLSRTLDRLAFTYFQHGTYDQALATAQRHLRIAEQDRDLGGKSAALDTIGLVYRITKDHGKAQKALEAALEAAKSAGTRQAMIHAANDLAGLHHELGDDTTAVRYLGEALQAAEEIGYRWMEAIAIHNVGELHLEHGTFAQARACFSSALRTAMELGDWTHMASRLGSLALAAAEQGERATGEQLLDRAITLARTLQAPYFLGEWLYRKAKLLASTNRLETAAQLNDEAREVAAAGDDRHILWRAQLLDVELSLALSRIKNHSALQRLHDLKAGWSEPAGQAFTLAAISAVDPTDIPAREDAITLLRTLSAQGPRIEYQQAYRRLTSQALPKSPPLPPLPDVVDKEHIDLDELLRRVDLDIYQLQAGTADRHPAPVTMWHR